MSIFSVYWYRVAEIKPCLRSHVRIERHNYRGQTWYVLQDPSTNRQHRFSKNAHHIIGLMDGRKTVQEIWDAVTTSLGDEAPTQDELIGLMGRLHAADVLQSDISPDTFELFQRQNRQRYKWRQGLLNPFSLRFPLFDPDRLLTFWMPFVKPFLGRAGFSLWLGIVLAGAVCAAMNWSQISMNVADRVLKPENLLLLWCVYPFVKLLHELGHAFVTRYFGGEIHEMGIMLLAFLPIPYVEASASASFPDKRKRIAVAGAGIAIELLVASLALFLWLTVESGKISALAYNVMLIGGFSTLLFNGNPLSRYDGYFILADWIEIPNLAQQSTRYLGYLLQRYALGLVEAESPVTGPGERLWFLCFGVASFCYRLLTLVLLSLFVSRKLPVVGVLIASLAICSQIVYPGVRHWCRLYNSVRSRGLRKRLATVASLAGLAVLIFLFVLPFPLKTRTEGVVSLSENSRIRAGTDCFISEIFIRDGSAVQNGASLVACEDPYLQAEVKVLEANLEEMQARYLIESLQSRKDREIVQQDIAKAEAELIRARERLDQLVITSPGQGILVLPESERLSGRFLKQGALLGYILNPEQSIVIAVVDQADIALMREKTHKVELRLASSLDNVFAAGAWRETPAASDELPSQVLATAGGGRFAVDPSDRKGLRTLSRLFQVEIRLPLDPGNIRIGERAHVLFDHGYEPLGMQWYRTFRQLFLRQFHA